MHKFATFGFGTVRNLFLLFIAKINAEKKNKQKTKKKVIRRVIKNQLRQQQEEEQHRQTSYNIL